jgi:phosphoglycolate phosphatase-like HAD superfamily hydrolase
VDRTLRSTLFIPTIAAMVFSVGYSSLAQESAAQPAKQLKAPNGTAIYEDSQWAPDKDAELLRKDLRSQKKQIIAANMDLTDTEAEKFWPVYDRYAADLTKIYDTKIALVEEYLDRYKTMSGDEAESYIRRRAAADSDIMQLRLKYVPEFRKVLSGRQTALFFQIEWRLDLLTNLQLAQTPLIDP